MSDKYSNKYTHNKKFLGCICEDYPEDFYDWKVTTQFYTCLHKCYCILLSANTPVVEKHSQNIKNLANIDKDVAKKMFRLFNLSRQSRYDGFLTEEAMLRINKMGFEEGSIILKFIEVKAEELLLKAVSR